MSHVLLVTNDYPPKLGGIQSYLYELWRRQPPGSVSVLTIAQRDAAAFDAAAPHPIARLATPMLLPLASVRRAVEAEAARRHASLVLLDPALPIGAIGPQLSLPYGVVLHGAEVTVPARLFGVRSRLARVLGGAALLVAAGGYPAAEVHRLLGRAVPPLVVVPPGVDGDRFTPLEPAARAAARADLGLPLAGRLVVGVSRLVPRKGFDVLIEAVGALAGNEPDLSLAIGGTGRDARRLARLAERHRAPVRFLGRVSDEQLPRLLAAADVAAMCCRDRWLGLEQEGFGIVFLEAAAAGVAVLAGRSGGSEEAVAHEETGLVVDRPGDVEAVKAALARLLADAEVRARFGAAGRRRAVEEFSYDLLARRLADALRTAAG
ncbi:MAG: glycosyltransferase family 4 protein [Actinomycetota bacterium]|nr:glycosyltransferase family 4 protein [Actinomycetota bacterium]